MRAIRRKEGAVSVLLSAAGTAVAMGAEPSLAGRLSGLTNSG